MSGTKPVDDDKGLPMSGTKPVDDDKGLPMSGTKPVDDDKAKSRVAEEPDELKGTMKPIGGSRSDHWNHILGNQALKTLWTAQSDEKTQNRQINATVAALDGIAPRDELEAMIAAQLPSSLSIETMAAAMTMSGRSISISS